jgi:spermidine synthase
MRVRQRKLLAGPVPLVGADSLLVWLYTLTIFVGAGLLFLVQPMFTRMILPLLGGAPAVWNTSVLFYEAVLLLGYGYAHLLTGRLGMRRQLLVHALMLLVPALVLPISVAHGLQLPAGASPIARVLLLLSGAVGLPFLVVSATNPLLQSWFSRSGHPLARDPYFLYAASNAGSLLGLLSYPFAIERVLRLAEQSWLWTGGYIALACLMVACGAVLWQRSRADRPHAAVPQGVPAERPSARRRLTWIGLAALPASLMLSVTTFITTDITPIPLLWAIPLALYLLTFILAFGSRMGRADRVLSGGLPFVLLGLAVLICIPTLRPLALFVPLHLLAFTWIALACHRAIAHDRPPPAHLTEYYFWISVGGVVGGVVNALLAPALFATVLEYPLGVVACALLGVYILRRPARPAGRSAWVMALSVPVIAVVATFAARAMAPAMVAFTVQLTLALVLLAHGVLVRHRPAALALALGALLWTGVSADTGFEWQTLVTRRSFFGVNRIAYSATEQAYALFHGRVIHGVQYADPALRQQPAFYYHRSGPLGAIISAAEAGPAFGQAQVGVVGLGAGSAACYRQPGQRWTFYEIDPEVVAIARDARYFTYLSDCAPDAQIEVGDARLELAHVTDGRYQLLVLDAYSSDSIPVHLLTREAFDVYLAALAPDGLIGIHITNRYLDLEPVVAALARDRGLTVRVRSDSVASAAGAAPSTWAVLARSPEALGRLARDPAWREPRSRSDISAWTDDFASVIPILR